ncbi:hypothetical protein [Propionimicrobium lymphophilum]|nr:hypothetical protein [Propionimicrobium lymphophilum]MDK7710637.1 hypothetical protein [Propionimicrobium lymphophilum]
MKAKEIILWFATLSAACLLAPLGVSFGVLIALVFRVFTASWASAH